SAHSWRNCSTVIPASIAALTAQKISRCVLTPPPSRSSPATVPPADVPEPSGQRHASPRTSCVLPYALCHGMAGIAAPARLRPRQRHGCGHGARASSGCASGSRRTSGRVSSPPCRRSRAHGASSHASRSASPSASRAWAWASCDVGAWCRGSGACASCGGDRLQHGARRGARIVGQLPLPCTLARCPAETVTLEPCARGIVRLPVEYHLQPVEFDVLDDDAAVERYLLRLRCRAALE